MCDIILSWPTHPLDFLLLLCQLLVSSQTPSDKTPLWAPLQKTIGDEILHSIPRCFIGGGSPDSRLEVARAKTN
jgi:hypothetical protein